MATLSNSFPKQSDSTAVIVPGKAPLTVSFSQLSAEISSFQNKLAKLGISRGAAVSIALPNTYEFIVLVSFRDLGQVTYKQRFRSLQQGGSERALTLRLFILNLR